ncbi:testis-expressed protein 38 isoform X3 [Antechinus flavipes]|uniref:testis-expressed protein 38 isoform X3 n=1 Tax=Antechinus flavipes TaxID=38775 RepID=UPI002236320B|nr:testis-expressed protein 38 isoform X3 [Antechinus flavipes]
MLGSDLVGGGRDRGPSLGEPPEARPAPPALCPYGLPRRTAEHPWCPLLYWINKRRQYGMNTGVKVDLPVSSPKPEVPKPLTSIPEGKSDAPQARFLMCPASAPPLVCYPTPAPHNPVFQEVAFAPSLGNVPPMVNHSASYPFAACPQRSVQFHSLPALARRDYCFNPKGLAYEL